MGEGDAPRRRVYLVRHGEAEHPVVDHRRPLTDGGRRAVEQVARALRQRDQTQLAEIRHSHKLRARQTAEVMASLLAPLHGPREVPGLAPNDDVRPIALELEHVEDTIMLAGHLPFMGILANRLAGARPHDDTVSFYTATLACFERTDDGWTLLYHIDAER